MLFKNRVLTAAAAAVFALSVFPLTAFADSKEADYEKKSVTTYLYRMDRANSSIVCSSMIFPRYRISMSRIILTGYIPRTLSPRPREMFTP
jgi:hypothetical protein